MEQSFEQIDKLEQLLESLIIMLGRSNRRLDDLSGRICQLEQYILEAAPQEIPFPNPGSYFEKLERPAGDHTERTKRTKRIQRLL